MGLCYSLRPLLFGSSEDAPCAASDPRSEDGQPSAVPAPVLVPAPTPAGTLLRRGAGRNPASARPAVELQSRRRQEQLRAEEREAAKEARKVSRGIDRMLREQKRDLQQTHRLLLLDVPLPATSASELVSVSPLSQQQILGSLLDLSLSWNFLMLGGTVPSRYPGLRFQLPKEKLPFSSAFATFGQRG